MRQNQFFIPCQMGGHLCGVSAPVDLRKLSHQLLQPRCRPTNGFPEGREKRYCKKNILGHYGTLSSSPIFGRRYSLRMLRVFRHARPIWDAWVGRMGFFAYLLDQERARLAGTGQKDSPSRHGQRRTSVRERGFIGGRSKKES